MKFLVSELSYFVRLPSTRRNASILLRFFAILLAMIVVYTVLFHLLMVAEGREHSWITGFYWTLTVMSTLGFGDITFQSDAGRLFSILVLISGVLFLLILFPFTFIQFFYAPWIEAQSRRRAPRELPEETRGHVILTSYDPVTVTLIDRLDSFGRQYVLLEGDLKRALELYDRGVRVMVGGPDDPRTYQRARAEGAALLAATGDDYANTNIAFTLREVAGRIPVVATARAEDSVEILKLAGASHVIQLAGMLGRSLARRALGGDVHASVVGAFDHLRIAEAPVTATPLIGKTLLESRIREATGVTVVGVWERGNFETARPHTRIESTTVLVMAGTEEQLERFNELTCIYGVPDSPVLILGGGRVGRAAAQTLKEGGVPYRIVEKNPERVRPGGSYVLGTAADLGVLEKAGIEEAPSTIVTTNDDATNIYLTIFCRRLRPDMRIISRATLERNVSTLHRAGADFVMSYASMGANAIFNVLERDDLVMLAEGLDIFRHPVPESLLGTTLRDSRIRETTGCSVVALERDGATEVNPDPEQPLEQGTELILIGTTEGERAFAERFAA